MFGRTKKQYAHLEGDPGRGRVEWLACDYSPPISRGYGSHGASPFLVPRPGPAQSPGWKPQLLTTAAPPVRGHSRDRVQVAPHCVGARVVEWHRMGPYGCPGVFLVRAFEVWMSSRAWGKLRLPALPS